MTKPAESRSIDVAKNASIDIMHLNKKVVNMRPVVKRTKVHVINKLCKHVNTLKKKKGTEEQKKQNLQKAERYIEEIDSIKKLKDDKISKYSLANTSSFAEVCKVTTSAGPRALARLADHEFIQKVVKDFRESHSDWRDLTAYLMVKQTGRRFKTKKQKETKLSKSVENINASEMMTKAYILERFGNEGLVKAELKFEQKRKRKASAMKKAVTEEEEEHSSMKKGRNSNIEGANSNEEGANSNTDSNETLKMVETTTPLDRNTEREPDIGENESGEQKSSSQKDTKNVKLKKEIQSAQQLSISLNAEDTAEKYSQSSDSESGSESEKKDNESSKKPTSDLVKNQLSSTRANDDLASSKSTNYVTPDVIKENSDSKKKKKSECVVKTLKLGAKREDSSESGSDEEESEESENNESGDSDSESGSSDQEESSMSKRQQKKQKKTLPSFLTTSAEKLGSDPFFAGSDDEDVSDTVQVEEDFGPGELSDDDEWNRKSFGSSMFHNPHGLEGEDERGDFRRQGRGRGQFRNDRGWRGKQRGSYRGRANSGREDGGRFERRENFGAKSFRGRGGGGKPSGERGRASFGENRSFGGQSRISGHDKDNQSSQQNNDFRFGNREKQRAPSSGHTTEPQEKLHPSWEASKRRKAEQSGIAAFKGSKITFDDD